MVAARWHSGIFATRGIIFIVGSVLRSCNKLLCTSFLKGVLSCNVIRHHLRSSGSNIILGGGGGICNISWGQFKEWTIPFKDVNVSVDLQG